MKSTENEDDGVKKSTAAEREERLEQREEKARIAFRGLITLNDEDDGEERIDFSLRGLLGGDMLAARWFIRQLPLIALVSVLTLLYVNNRYTCQQNEIKRAKLENELKHVKMMNVTVTSQLTHLTMQENILSILPDSTLVPSGKNIYYLP